MSRANLHAIERRRNLETERQERARSAALAVERGKAETIALRRVRGDEIETPPANRGERAKPALVLDGLDFLARQKVLTQPQYQAGRRWGAFYVMLETGDLKSALSSLEIKSQTHDLDPSQRKVFARYKLESAKGALNEHKGMIDALNAICGEGRRPSELSGDRRANEKATNFLNCALTILAKHWGV